jgi:hypothetical protein
MAASNPILELVLVVVALAAPHTSRAHAVTDDTTRQLRPPTRTTESCVSTAPDGKNPRGSATRAHVWAGVPQ